MVHLVVLQGLPQTVTNGVETLKTISNGWCVLTRGVDPQGKAITTAMLVQTQHATETVRDFLGRMPGIQVVVVRLKDQWSSRGLDQVAGWLKNVDMLF